MKYVLSGKETIADDVIRKLALVNDEHRVYNTDTEAAKIFGFNPDLLSALAERGMSYATVEGNLFYDSDDLYNLSLYLSLPSIHKLAMRSWKKAFSKGSYDKTFSISYSFQEKVSLPAQFSVITIEEEKKVMEIEQPENFYRVSSRIVQQTQSLPPPLCDMLVEMTIDVEFYMLHDAIRWDTDFIQRYKMAECGGFSKLLMEKAQEVGFEVRHVFGILLSEPYGTGHFWVEFNIDGEWVAVDPLMIRLMNIHANFDSDDWPIYRLPAGALLRLSVIDRYDDIGAPILSCFDQNKFFRHPVVTSNNTEYPLTYSISTA